MTNRELSKVGAGAREPPEVVGHRVRRRTAFDGAVRDDEPLSNGQVSGTVDPEVVEASTPVTVNLRWNVGCWSIIGWPSSETRGATVVGKSVKGSRSQPQRPCIGTVQAALPHVRVLFPE